MANFGLPSPSTYFFFSDFFYQSSGRSTLIFVYLVFSCFCAILLWRIVFVGFHQLVTAGISVLGDSDDKNIFDHIETSIQIRVINATDLESYEF